MPAGPPADPGAPAVGGGNPPAGEGRAHHPGPAPGTAPGPEPLPDPGPGPGPDPGPEPGAEPGAAAPDGDRPGGVWTRRVARWSPLLVVAACAAYVLVQQSPALLLRDTTANGGDMGAHVWFPAYLRDHLLPHGRIAGWAPDWYAGFPAGQFYFPLPALLVVALDVVLPYDVAFKLVTALGPVLVPVGAYVFGRGLRAPRPAPELMAAGSVAFLFFKGDPGTGEAARAIVFNQHIMGGTLTSNLAGEFSFTLALALAFAFLGVLAVALRDGRGRAVAAALLAAVVLSHLVVAIFAAVGAVVVWAAHRPRRTLGRAAAIGGVAALLTAVWTLPLLTTFSYTVSMNYEKIRDYRAYLLPGYFWPLYLLGGVALAVGVAGRRRSTIVLAVITAAFAAVFVVWPQSHAWNLRFLPFWYAGLYLLAAVGAAELLRGVATVATSLGARGAGAGGHLPARRATAALLAAVLAAAVLYGVHSSRGYLTFWVNWNYSGYQDATGTKPKPWDEFRALVAAVDRLPPGRALWEGGQAIDAYGTSLALELLPHFTGGRIDSMEGLYFESSATTPYHFLTAATLEGPGNASNPVRGLHYRTLADFSLGVRYMQLLGVRYYLAHSTEARAAASADGRLRKVATVADRDGQAPLGWEVYRVPDAGLVEPLTRTPVVVTGARAEPAEVCYGASGGDSTPAGGPVLNAWECVAVRWFDEPSALARPLAAGGPRSWPRVTADDVREGRFAPRAGSRPLAPVEVSRVRVADDRISFDVSRPGVPVLVKVSAFPNWRARGADGPWRATPNFMVVVPTSRHVEIVYSRTAAEWLGLLGTLAGLVGLGALVVVDRRRRAEGGADDPEAEPVVVDPVADAVGDPVRVAAGPRPEAPGTPPVDPHHPGAEPDGD